MYMQNKTLQDLARFYRSHLFDNLLAFWEPRTRDETYGGYLHNFDREGNLTGTDKNLWCQGRQLWLFSTLYNKVDKQPKWLDLAKCGRDFIVKHGYQGNGRWHYLLDQEGNVKVANRSYFTDAFVLAGLAEYAKTSNSDEDHTLIQVTFDEFEKNLRAKNFNEYHHFDLNPDYQWHGVYMVGLFVATAVRDVVDDSRVNEIVDYCLNTILNVFAQDDYQILFEAVGRDGRFVDDEIGRTINPGHSFESMWFCMEAALQLGDRKKVDRCCEIIQWTWDKGVDPQYGGIFNIIDYTGEKPLAYQNQEGFGELWDDKVWWVHSETLYTLLLAATETNNKIFFDRFISLHDWTRKHFIDDKYGEWYAYLNRDASPRIPDKGNWIKCAFHVPRNIMQIMLLLEKIDITDRLD
jgi:N-acylglucosamine 2-epimerase